MTIHIWNLTKVCNKHEGEYERDKNLVLTVKPVLSENKHIVNIVYNETHPYFSLLFKIRVLILNIFSFH